MYYHNLLLDLFLSSNCQLNEGITISFLEPHIYLDSGLLWASNLKPIGD